MHRTSNIKGMHSPCKNCVFAKYEGITQTDCRLGLIDRYKQTDFIDILEAYDEEKEFYIINGKKCAGYREQNYFESRKLQDTSIEEKTKYIQNTLKLKYLAIIDCKNRTPEQLYDILTEMSKANVKPHMIMVVIANGCQFSFNDFYKQGIYKSGLGCKWKIKGVAHKDQDLITTAHQSINIGAENCNFVLCVGEDTSKLNDIINKADSMVYGEFKSFSVISNSSKETIIFNKFVYVSALQANHDIITNYEDYITI